MSSRARARTTVIAAASALAAFAAFAACANLDGLAGGLAEDAGGADGSSPPLPGPTDAGADTETRDALADAADASDACTGCDCDFDGVPSIACGGSDCDDGDSRVRPGAGFLTEVTWTSKHVPMFDWDCNGQVDKQYTVNLECSSAPGACGMAMGFSGDPPCGTTGPFVACRTEILGACSKANETARAQGCR